ncbi:MAG: hypothetical protein ACOYMX_07675, partial [Burkholderiales bacterium]
VQQAAVAAVQRLGGQQRRRVGRQRLRPHAHGAAEVVAILVENGGHGGSAAAPVARKMMDYWLLGKMPDAPAEVAQ